MAHPEHQMVVWCDPIAPILVVSTLKLFETVLLPSGNAVARMLRLVLKTHIVSLRFVNMSRQQWVGMLVGARNAAPLDDRESPS
jgi:hypothetical protein